MKKRIKQISVLSFLMIFMCLSCTDDLNITPNDEDVLLGEELFQNEECIRTSYSWCLCQSCINW